MRRGLPVFSKVISKKKRDFQKEFLKFQKMKEPMEFIFLPYFWTGLSSCYCQSVFDLTKEKWFSVCVSRSFSDVRPSSSRKFLKGLILFLFSGKSRQKSNSPFLRKFYDHPGLSLGRKRQHWEVDTSRIGWKHGSTDNTKPGRRSSIMQRTRRRVPFTKTLDKIRIITEEAYRQTITNHRILTSHKIMTPTDPCLYQVKRICIGWWWPWIRTWLSCWRKIRILELD